MKKYIAIGLLLVVPFMASAQSINQQYVSALTQLIQLLEQKLVFLESELANTSTTTPVVIQTVAPYIPQYVVRPLVNNPVSLVFGSTQATSTPVCVPNPVMYISTSSIPTGVSTGGGEGFSVSWSADLNNCGVIGTIPISWIIKDSNQNIITEGSNGDATGGIITSGELQSFGDSSTTPLTATLTSGTVSTTVSL